MSRPRRAVRNKSRLIRILSNKLDVSQRQIYNKIKKIKDELGFGFSDDIASLVLAGEEGIDVYKFIEPEYRDDYRKALGLRPRTIQRVAPNTPTEVIKVMKVPDMPDLTSPNLTDKIFIDARKMAEAYYYLYLFENSLRIFIIDILSTTYGDSWWENKTNLKIRDKARKRIAKEEKNRWHSSRGAHPIFYVDIDDLKKIIIRNQSDFEPLLPENPIEWLTQRINEIELSRNIIAHHNPLGNDDIEQVKRYFRQWTRQLPQ